MHLWSYICLETPAFVEITLLLKDRFPLFISNWVFSLSLVGGSVQSRLSSWMGSLTYQLRLISERRYLSLLVFDRSGHVCPQGCFWCRSTNGKEPPIHHSVHGQMPVILYTLSAPPCPLLLEVDIVRRMDCDGIPVWDIEVKNEGLMKRSSLCSSKCAHHSLHIHYMLQSIQTDESSHLRVNSSK